MIVVLSALAILLFLAEVHVATGGCILQYRNYSAALQPCNCPMCSKKLTDLTPEASLYSQQNAEVIEVLKKVRKYNRLFIGGTYGLMLKVLGLPFYMKRLFNEMMNPDRPGAHLNKLRIFAAVKMLLMCLITLPLHYPVLYLVGLYLRRRRFRHVREMAAADFAARCQLPANEADICSQLIVELEDFGFPKILLCFCDCVLWQV